MSPIIFKVCFKDSKDFLFQHAEQDGARNWNWKNRISNQKEKGQQQNNQLLPNISLYTQKHKPKWVIWDILKIYPLRVASKFSHNSIKGLETAPNVYFNGFRNGSREKGYVLSSLRSPLQDYRVQSFLNFSVIK